MTTDVRLRRGPDVERFADRARKARRLRWLRRLLLLVVIAAISSGVWAVGWSTLFGVRQIEVVGQSRLSAADVRTAADVTLDQPMVRVDLHAIRLRVAALPVVSHVVVTRDWPHTVRIQITERLPVAVVRRGTERRLISADGVDFAPAPALSTFPLLDLDMATASKAQASAGLAVIRNLPGSLSRRLSSVAVVGTADVRLYLRGGTTLLWGTATRNTDKAAVFAALQRVNPNATFFDVSAPDAPTVRT